MKSRNSISVFELDIMYLNISQIPEIQALLNDWILLRRCESKSGEQLNLGG